MFIKMRNPVRYFLGLERKDQRMIFIMLTAVTNVMMFVYNLTFGVINMSLWMLINAVFYFVIIISRYLSLKNYGKSKRAKNEVEAQEMARADYRNTGILLIVLALVYALAGAYMFNSAIEHDLHEYAIYGTAFMAFWSLGFSIAGIIKYKKNTNLIVRAAVLTSLAVAITAIVATQEALLSRFGGGENYAQINGAAGWIASVIIFIMGICMILTSRKHI
ncbi:MAG: hypothetical protein ACK5MU_01035 [Candidatus Saccharimonadales bacterium]